MKIYLLYIAAEQMNMYTHCSASSTTLNKSAVTQVASEANVVDVYHCLSGHTSKQLGGRLAYNSQYLVAFSSCLIRTYFGRGLHVYAQLRMLIFNQLCPNFQ